MQVASNPALANPAPVSPPPPPAAPSDPQAAAGPGPNGTPSASDPAATGPGEQPGSYFAGYTKPLIQRPDGTTFAPGPGAPLLDVAAQAVTAFGAQPESFTAMTQPLYLGRASSGLLADLMSGGQPLPTGGDAPWGRPEFMPRPQAALADMGMLSRPGVTTNNKGPLRVDNPDAYFAGTAPGRLQRVPDLVQRQPDGRGSQGEQDAFSGQPGNQDGQHPLFQQAEEVPAAQASHRGPYPPGKDGHPLRATEPFRPPGKDGHPLRATEPLRPPGKDGNPLRATEPSPPTDGQIPESATSKTPEAKPVDPAAPVAAPGEAGAVAPTGPTADPMEIQALELMLADPANKEMVANFGGELKPAVTGNDVADSIVARYGSDLAGRLTQMQTAQQEVQKQYMAALDAAIYSPGAKQPGSMFIGSEYNSALPAGMQGLPLRPGVGPRGESGSWVLDPVAFTNEWSKGDSALQKAFAYLHGNDAVQRVTVGQGETEDTVLAFGRQKLTPAGNRSADDDPDAGTSKLSVAWDHIDPKDPPKLLNNDMVWFDPSRGWVTDPDNLKPDGLDRAMPIVFGAAMSFMTMGAASAAMGVTSTTALSVGQGAVLGAVGGVTNQLVNVIGGGRFDFKQVLVSAISGGATAGLMNATGLGQMVQSADTATRLIGYAGRAGLQGAIQQATGGRFADGFINSAMGSLASEVTQTLNAEIAKLEQTGSGLTAGESSMMRLLSRAAGSALRIVGTGDPAAGFASDFLSATLGEAQQAQDAGNRTAETDTPDSAAPGERAPSTAEGLAPTAPTSVTVASGDTLERVARQQYGENWRAGLTAMVASNPGMTTNRWGSPIIQAGQTLNTPSLDGLGADQLNQLGRVGGEIVAGNTRGLNVRAEYLAQQRAASQRAAAQAAAQQQQVSGSGGMTPQEAQDRFSGRSGSFARQMGEDYKLVWHGDGTQMSSTLPARNDSIRPSQAGWENVWEAGRAYLMRDDVSLSQALGMAWRGGGNDLVAGAGHALGAGTSAVGAVASSPSIVGSAGLGLLSAQQADAAVADFRRFFGSGEARGTQSTLTQGLTPLIGSDGAATVNAGIDFVFGSRLGGGSG